MEQPKELIDVDKVVIYYQCCECKYVVSMPLKDHLNIASICGECTHLENFLEIIGVIIEK